jgi:hypothetical protein
VAGEAHDASQGSLEVTNGIAPVENLVQPVPAIEMPVEELVQPAPPNDVPDVAQSATPEQAATAPEDAEMEDVAPSPGAILSSLRGVLGSMRRVSFGRSTLKEIDDLMFDIKLEAYDALKRNIDS